MSPVRIHLRNEPPQSEQMSTFLKRMLVEPDKRVLRKFVWDFGFKGMRAVQKFEKRMKKGEFFPAFMFLSVTDSCNLSCQGCWVTQSEPARKLDVEVMDRVISQCKEKGSSFFGIMGGEPLLHTGLFELFHKHPDAYFLLFTNGTLITDKIAAEMRSLGNVSPLISIEGSVDVSDARRGSQDVYERTMVGLEHCRKNRLIFGAATSVCKSNINDLATESFINELAGRGVFYLWYYIYRPVGPNPCPELALSPEEIVALRRFIVNARKNAPMMIVDAYWDHEGKALCPAAVGMAHHINPAGDVEPCPPIQFAMDNIGNGSDLADLFAKSEFLARFRKLACESSRGCIIMERPELLKDLIVAEGARDTSGRNCGTEELDNMKPHMSQCVPGEEIPETSMVYRFAKKNWFFGFGAYG